MSNFEESGMAECHRHGPERSAVAGAGVQVEHRESRLADADAKQRAPGSRSRDVREWTVVDDWQAEVSVMGSEVEVLEAYLGSLLDELLTRASSISTARRH